MFFYNLIIRLYGIVIFNAAIKNTKAKQWVKGRQNWRSRLTNAISKLNSEKRIWIHCASYGEFEQGRPLIEAIKKKHPDYKIILSFFSPSGYEAFKDWQGAEVICYLPLDTRKNARDFIEIVKPKTVIFIKYEFWLNFLSRLKKERIPTFLVSAVFKSHHPFFKSYGGIFRRSLETFNRLFIQDENSATLLEFIGVKNYEVSGDTRFDRVLEIKKNFKSLPFFDEFCESKTILVGGSTWPKDEELLINTFKELNSSSPNLNLKLILVPHNVDSKSIKSLEQQLEKHELSYVLYSRGINDPSAQVLVVDAMGLLSRLYHYANVTYVGGGFNSGIHNCLEPAVYFKPVIFYGGNDYQKYNEAVDLLKMGVAKNVSDIRDTKEALQQFLDKNETEKVKNKLAIYFVKNSGTTEKVLNSIKWN
jgi:3-deoxy-D-manno-octulosonic-acid transferase